MGQFHQPWRQVLVTVHLLLQEGDELSGQLGKQRRLATVIGVEGMHQSLPAPGPEAGLKHRECTAQQGLDIAEKQLPVNRQPPRLDTGRWRVPLRVAHVAGQAQQLLVE
ncbi:hypothetical protein D3C86_1812860 [compost metagenome]